MVGNILGPRKSRVENGKGTAVGGHHGEPVRRLHYLSVSGAGDGVEGLIYPLPVTVPCTAAFSLAGTVSAVAEELG